MTTPEIVARAISITDDGDKLRLLIGIDGDRKLAVILSENMIDLLASEIVRHRLKQTDAA